MKVDKAILIRGVVKSQVSHLYPCFHVTTYKKKKVKKRGNERRRSHINPRPWLISTIFSLNKKKETKKERRGINSY